MITTGVKVFSDYNVIPNIFLKKFWNVNLHFSQPYKKQSSGPDSCTGEFYQKEGKAVSRHSLFQEVEEEGMFLNSFYELNITLILKPDKDNIKKETTKD